MPVYPNASLPKAMKRWRIVSRQNLRHIRTLVLVALFVHTPTQSQTTQAELPTQAIYVGMHRIMAEMAIMPEQRAIGLMGRSHLAENSGMLFVFDRQQRQCFWMEQTLIPLSIAFLKDDGTITNIEHMQPLTRHSHCSSEPVRLALELNQGWFEKHNITSGARVRGLPEFVIQK